MAFKDFTELYEALILPINGKLYRIPPVGLLDGVRLTACIDEASEETMTDTEFRQILLGTALEEMTADNVPAAAVSRALVTALSEFQRGRATAEIIWETGGDPKAVQAWLNPTPNRAQRRSASTGTAKKTPIRASTNGMSSRKSATVK